MTKERPDSTVSRRVPHPALVDMIRLALAAAGAPEAVYAVEADVMAEADLMGTPSHGVRMLPGLLKAIKSGMVHASPQIKMRHDHAAVCVLDCDQGPGRYVSWQAMQEAMNRASRFGVGVCLAANTSHWGRAHAYAWRAARAGMIGLCTTNAQVGMLGFGSDRPLLGNNPLAIGVPRRGNTEPVVLDIAMSQAAVGKVATSRREGQKAPLDWGLDRAGNPTDDPAEILASRKFLPMGGHKGAGLALVFEMLTGALAGGPLCYELAQADPSGTDVFSSKFFLALDPKAFGDPARFEQRVEDLLAYLLASAKPGEVVLYPGQRGGQTRDINLARGVPVHNAIVAELEAAGVILPGRETGS